VFAFRVILFYREFFGISAQYFSTVLPLETFCLELSARS
jgi:hypothetical protein